MKNHPFYCRHCGAQRTCKILREYYHQLAIKVTAKCTVCRHTFDGLIKKPPIARHNGNSHTKNKAVHL
jgi:hypothetical protein